MRYGGRDAATGGAVRRLAPAVEWQTDVNPHHRLAFLSVTRTSPCTLPSCGALPQPRSSRMPAADTRAAGGMASWLTMPASTLMHSSVCPRASDRKSADIFFRGKDLRGGSTPSLLAQARARTRVRRGDNHVNNIAQKRAALLTKDTMDFPSPNRRGEPDRASWTVCVVRSSIGPSLD